MWGYFALCVLAGTLLLYVPGFLVWKALRFQRDVALLAAPLATVGGIGVLGIAFAQIGIACNWLTVCGTIALAGAIGCAFHYVADRRADGGPEAASPRDARIALQAKCDARCAVLCAIIGLAVACGVFVACLGNPDAFFSRYDNAMHLNLIRSFADSGMWSSLTPDRYSASVASPDASLGFYPAAWHGFAAAICSLTGCSAPIAINASMVVAFAFIVPTSMYLLCCVLFPGEHLIGVAASVMLCLLPVFPYMLLWKGPLYPQIFAYSLLISVLALAIQFLKSRAAKNHIASFVICGVISMCAVALCQPNGLFSFFVFFVTYVGHELWAFASKWNRIPSDRRSKTAVACMIAYSMLAIGFWVVCYKLPFMQSVVNYTWKSQYNVVVLAQRAFAVVTGKPIVAVAGILAVIAACVILRFVARRKNWWVLLIPVCLLAFVRGEVLLFAFGLVGCVECIRRKTLWLMVPAILMGIGSAVGLTVDGFVRHLLIGFWYTDTPRVECCFCLFAMPIVGLGVAATARHLKRAFASESNEKKDAAASLSAFGAGILCVCVLLSAFPVIQVPGTSKQLTSDRDRVVSRLSKIYTDSVEQVFSEREQAFVREAVDMVPEGSMVANVPWDGSVFAYGTDGLQTFYRYFSTGGTTNDANVIRTQLNEVAENDQVRQSLAENHVEYVLLLDQGVAYESGVWLPQYSDSKSRQWEAIGSIRDDTPGFSIVLAEDDMRLYKIDAV